MFVVLVGLSVTRTDLLLLKDLEEEAIGQILRNDLNPRAGFVIVQIKLRMLILMNNHEKVAINLHYTEHWDWRDATILAGVW